MSAEWVNDPELDALLEKGRTETNEAERIKIYQAANQVMIDNAITLFITDGFSYVWRCSISFYNSSVSF